MIIDCVRANPGDVTIVCSDHLRTLPAPFRRDPALPGMIDRLVITGGTVSGAGNITPAAEFNFYFDPEAARTVLNSRTTKTLIPLDVTTQVTFGLDMLDDLPGSDSRCGYFLRAGAAVCFPLLPAAARSRDDYAQRRGRSAGRG